MELDCHYCLCDCHCQHSGVFSFVVPGSIVNSAENQLAVCRKNYMLKRDSAEVQDAKLIFTRSLDIYRQSVKLFNRTLLKPYNYIPGLLMGFRKINERTP